MIQNENVTTFVPLAILKFYEILVMATVEYKVYKFITGQMLIII